MKLITEQDLRAELGGKDIRTYSMDRGVIVTPSARQYLSDRKIELVVRDAPEGVSVEPRQIPVSPQETQPERKPRFIGPDGGTFTEKPEHLTHLSGNRLVSKGHPRIAFRGKLDSFQSMILEAQCRVAEHGNTVLAEELDEVLDFVRSLLASEVTGKEFDDRDILGLGLDDIRVMSHNPKKFFGIGHVRPHYSMGTSCVAVNYLRSAVRDVELAAFRAFKGKEGAVERPDILRALNRLSSTLYVLMYRHLPEGYDKQY